MKVVYKYKNVGKVFSDPESPVKKANDATLNFLKNRARNQQEKQNIRSKRIRGIAFLGITSIGDLRFSTKSEDGSEVYLQSIRFYDLMQRRPKTRNEILDMMKNSDIGVYCSDPSFLHWGAAYNATKQGYNIVVENRPPTRSIETKEKFTLCKHLIALLQAVPFYWNNIVREYVKFFGVIEAEEQKTRKVEKVAKIKPKEEVEEVETVEEPTKVTSTKKEEELEDDR